MNQIVIALSALRILLLAFMLFGAIFQAPALAKPEKDKSTLSEYWQEDGKLYNIACENGSVFEKLKDDSLELKSGTFLVESEGTISLHMPSAVVSLNPHGMVLVRVTPGCERVYCMLETATLENKYKSVILSTGDEALYTDHMFQKREVTGEYDVGVRRVKAYNLNENNRIATMEFSILQAIEKEPLLSQISHSQHSHDCFLRDKLLKSAAVLSVVTGQHGQYIPYTGP